MIECPITRRQFLNRFGMGFGGGGGAEYYPLKWSNRLGQSGLWRFGISGDYPILLVEVDNPKQIDLPREALLTRSSPAFSTGMPLE